MTDDRIGTWLIAWNNPKTSRFAWTTYENTTRENAETKWRMIHTTVRSYTIYEKIRTVTT